MNPHQQGEIMETETPSLWNTKQTDLTVADSLKITVVIMAVMVATTVAFAGVSAAWTSVGNRRKNRKANETTTETEEK